MKQILRDGVICELEAPLKRGDGIVFDAGDPTQKKEEGGRVYDIRRKGVKLEGEAPGGMIEIVQEGTMSIWDGCMSATGFGRRTILIWIKDSAKRTRRTSLTTLFLSGCRSREFWAGR